MKPPASSFDTKAPRRAHRTIQPWIDRNTGAAADLSKKELANQAAAWPLKTLVEELSMDPVARNLVIQLRGEIGKLAPLEEEFGEAVRDGEDAAIQKVIEVLEGQEKVVSDLLADTARRYVRRKGRSQEAVMEIFRRAAASTRKDAESAFRSLWSRAVWVSSELDENDPKQWGHAKNDRLIAARVCMIGARRCSYGVAGSVCGQELASDHVQSLYCTAHVLERRKLPQRHREKANRNDRAEITKFLHRVGDALRLP